MEDSLKRLAIVSKLTKKYLQVGKAHPGRDEMLKMINQAIGDFRNEGNPFCNRHKEKGTY